MEVDPADGSLHLVEADVVEPFEARAGDLAHPVVGDEERLLPAHEDVLALRAVLVVEVGFLRLFGEGTPC